MHYQISPDMSALCGDLEIIDATLNINEVDCEKCLLLYKKEVIHYMRDAKLVCGQKMGKHIHWSNMAETVNCFMCLEIINAGKTLDEIANNEEEVILGGKRIIKKFRITDRFCYELGRAIAQIQRKEFTVEGFLCFCRDLNLETHRGSNGLRDAMRGAFEERERLNSI
ncbi:MAG: hypothetical protein R3321_03505 [Nitrososphaeraceae archaeon]|nr:hypothetical protein [Nitrososphaeraceae archaeon]